MEFGCGVNNALRTLERSLLHVAFRSLAAHHGHTENIVKEQAKRRGVRNFPALSTRLKALLTRRNLDSTEDPGSTLRRNGLRTPTTEGNIQNVTAGN